jgi:hypothetical protein
MSDSYNLTLNGNNLDYWYSGDLYAPYNYSSDRDFYYLNTSGLTDGATYSFNVADYEFDVNSETYVSSGLLYAGLYIKDDSVTNSDNFFVAYDAIGSIGNFPGSIEFVYDKSSSYAFSFGIGQGSSADYQFMVSRINSPPSITSLPATSVDEDSAYSYSISATDADGDTLYTDPSNFVLPSWLSLSGGTISGTPTDADVGSHNVTVAITDNSGGTDTQSFTIVVQNVNDAPIGSPTISGTAREGETLTVSTDVVNDADGLGSFSYQWFRSGFEISGATSSSYTLTTDDVGENISVRVSFTDQGGTLETVSSTATADVGNAETDIALTIGTQSSAKLGNKWGSLTDADGLVTASFDVTDTSKDLTLSLTGYDIDYGDEISLKLNGKSIGYLSAGRDNGTSSHSVTLSSSDLQSGTNTIEFVQSIPAWK